MEEVTYIRNPYPVPDVVREGTWIRRPVLGSKVSPKDKRWSANLKSHERLFAHHTLNSIRKDARLMRFEVIHRALTYISCRRLNIVLSETSFLVFSCSNWKTLLNGVKT